MMLEVKQEFDEDYFSQAETLGKEGMDQILEAGRAWDLSETLRSGGSAIFPHAKIRLCGHQIAAVVHGLLDCGADQVLVLGVVHTRDNSILNESRLEEMRGEPLSDLTYWGVFQDFPGEYSLHYFKALWDAEIKRRGMRPPKLFIRYPCLANGEPESLLGIEELERISQDAAVVLTGDLVHHGVAYKTELQMNIGPHSEVYTRDGILEIFRLLEKEDYPAFVRTCIHYRNDAKDSLSVLRHLRGPLEPEILDLCLVDTSDLFINDPSPSWVAASLIELKN